jgi:uncharacterized protein YndB with AHSA1/START domain
MSTTTHHETTIEAHPTLPAVIITREFDAAPAKVFRAHVDPELVVQWLGPRGIDMTIDRWDCRPGGEYRYVHRDANGEYAFRGCFHDVRPNESIVQTWTWEELPDSVSLDRLTLTDLGDGRTRLTGTSTVESFEARDAVLASGMEAGVNEGYERLDDVLAQLD